MPTTNDEQIKEYRKTEDSKSLILFVHGFKGDAGSTFAYIPDTLAKTNELNGWDVISLGYDCAVLPNFLKGIWTATPDVPKLAKYLNTLFQTVYQQYNRIAIVAHSMGGLVTQSALLELSSDELNRVSHVLLFGTPSNGLTKAKFFSFLNKQISDMGEGSEFITKLRAEWKDRFKDGYPFSFRAIAGTSDEFVPPKSSLECFAEDNVCFIDGNHSTLVKSKSQEDTSSLAYNIIVNCLANKDLLPFTSSWEEKNNLLGNYAAVIQALYPKASNLSNSHLLQLVFALENLNRQDDAKKILEEHPSLKTNSDLIGTLGGRYKRRYLQEGLLQDYSKSVSLYTQALEMAQSQSNPSQIYYHAINLAFLSIMEGDKNQCQHFARLALKNCNLSSQNFWELATIAEANLYEEKFDLALDYYKKALENEVDIRQRDSIFLNASFGYKALTGNTSNDSDFILKLQRLVD
jgi:tetratricopeptide (TPR) repeat protein